MVSVSGVLWSDPRALRARRALYHSATPLANASDSFGLAFYMRHLLEVLESGIAFLIRPGYLASVVCVSSLGFTVNSFLTQAMCLEFSSFNYGRLSCIFT